MDQHQRTQKNSEWTHHGVTVLTLKNLSNRLAYRHQLFLPMGHSQALKQLSDVDLVHLHGHRHLLNNAAVNWAKQNHIPYVMTSNGTLHRHEKKIGIKWLWDQLISGQIPHGARRCIAVSRADVARHIQAGIPVERVQQIPNGLDLGEFDPLPERGTFRARIGAQPHEKIVAYLGQISPRKGVNHLVEAFADNALPNTRLVIGGNDMGALSEVLAKVGDNAPIHFTGLLEGRERLALLADADVLVYASTEEVFGLVPFEGLLCGAPVVVGDDCGCGELIAEAGAGLLVRHGDISGLRARIQTLLNDAVAARAMVNRGRKYIIENLNFDKIAEQHCALYEDVLSA